MFVDFSCSTNHKANFFVSIVSCSEKMHGLHAFFDAYVNFNIVADYFGKLQHLFAKSFVDTGKHQT